MKKVILVVAIILAALAALFFLFPQKAANYDSPAADQEQQNESKESVFLSVPYLATAIPIIFLPLIRPGMTGPVQNRPFCGEREIC